MKEKRQQTTADKIIGTIVALAIISLPIFWFAKQSSKAPDVTYNATVGRYGVLNPSSVEVMVTVANTGKKDGTPFCVLEVSDEAGSYKGKVSQSVGITLKPTESKDVRLVVPVGNNGAAYITSGHATCV